jgi:sugar-specific transcriptional regulator TrmB
MHIRRELEELGFHPHEADVYLSVLELGDIRVSDIAENTSLPRTSVHIILEKLHKRGLINFYTKRRSTYWIAENPEKILSHLKEQENIARELIPKLKIRSNVAEGRPVVKVYTGAEEIKMIHNDIIETRHDAFAIIAWDDWVKLFGEDYLADYVKRRVRHNLKMKILAPRSESALRILKNKDAQELRMTRFFTANIEIDNTSFLYGNKYAIISLNRRLPTGVVIEDESISKTMACLFNVLWEQASV